MVRLPASHIEPARVHALLGPTNTGKTHRAIERMLEFDTGMMGLPLRLLAREVYDRVTARLGEQAVALITGEEKRVPPAARYFICTVEAMPRDLAVDFLAIDEVQLVRVASFCALKLCGNRGVKLELIVLDGDSSRLRCRQSCPR